MQTCIRFCHQRGAQMWDCGVRFGWCEGGSVEGFLFHIGNNMTPFTRARMAFRPYRHIFINGGANDAMLRSAGVPFHGCPSLRVLFVDPVPTFRLDPSSFLTGVQHGNKTYATMVQHIQRQAVTLMVRKHVKCVTAGSRLTGHKLYSTSKCPLRFRGGLRSPLHSHIRRNNLVRRSLCLNSDTRQIRADRCNMPLLSCRSFLSTKPE